jgi:hypothetical protein
MATVLLAASLLAKNAALAWQLAIVFFSQPHTSPHIRFVFPRAQENAFSQEEQP